jgi:hypothetical protein
MKKWQLAKLSAVSLLALGVCAQASNLVLNGDFETTTITGSGQVAPDGSNLSNWTVACQYAGCAGYTFLYSPGTGDVAPGAPSLPDSAHAANGNVYMWGPQNGVSNGFASTSPNGGNYVAQDGLYQPGALQQTLTGLTPGQKYTLSFDQAFAQQHGFFGANTAGWTVSVGGSVVSTTSVSQASQGFTPWNNVTVMFTATTASELLSFLATGGPQPLPQFSLLDSVSVTPAGTPPAPTPVPAAFPLFAGALGLIGIVSRRRQKKMAAV